VQWQFLIFSYNHLILLTKFYAQTLSALFIKQGKCVFVVEIKGDEEISEPSPENVKKHEFAVEHFQRLNEWLQKDGSATRYQFNMLTPRGYGIFFTKLRAGELAGFRSELDVAMARATVGG